MNKVIRWTCKNDEIKFETISKVQDILIVIFPKDFVEIAMKNDGAYPQPNRFEVNGSEEIFNNLLSFNEDDCKMCIRDRYRQ